MRYTIEKQKECERLAAMGKSLEYISSATGIPKKVIWQWCPELRPHEDVIRLSVKQRYHYMFPDWEAKISAAFSPMIREDISEDAWDELNKVIYDVLYEEALYVFKNTVSDPPNFSEMKKLSNDKFLDYVKAFWNYGTSEYIKENAISKKYADRCKALIHYWSPIKNKLLRDVTKGDIEIINEKLSAKDFGQSHIYAILKVGLIPLEYAYNNGLTLLKSYDYKLPVKHQKKDYSLDYELVSKLFGTSWNNTEAYIANLIGYSASLSYEEVRNLKLGDIYTDGEIKVGDKFVKVSQDVIDAILKYASTSPYTDYKSTDYVLYSADRDKPVSFRQSRKWTDELKAEFSKYSDENISFTNWYRNQ